MKLFIKFFQLLAIAASVAGSKLIIAVPNSANPQQQLLVTQNQQEQELLAQVRQFLQMEQNPVQQQQQRFPLQGQYQQQQPYPLQGQYHQQQRLLVPQQQHQQQRQFVVQEQQYQNHNNFANQRQQQLSKSWTLPDLIQSQSTDVNVKAETKSDDGAISIIIKLDPKHLLALQPQSNQRAHSQASTIQNSIVEAPQVNSEASYDSVQGFWKEFKGILGGFVGTFSKPAAQKGAHAQSTQVQSTYIQPAQLATYFQNVGNLNQNQNQNLQNRPLPPLQIATPFQIQPQQQKPQQQNQNPFYLLRQQAEPSSTTAAPTSDDDGTPMLVNVASTLVKTVSQIPSNLDLLFNDMGRTYRKHLFQLRDSMPEGSFSGMGYPSKKGKKQRKPNIGNEEFLDGYGV